MTKKSKNSLLLCISLFCACIIIPWGIKNDWPLWLFFVTIPVLCAGICISWWGTDYGYDPLPLEKMSRKDKIIHYCSWLSMLTGFYLIGGMFGDARWLVLIGCAIMIASSFAQRYLAKKYGK